MSRAPEPAPPLWRQLQAAAAAVQGVREGRSLSALLEAVAPAWRPGVQALAFHALRQLGRAEALRRQLARRAPPPAADALLCTALALACHEGDTPLYTDFTLASQTVEAAKRQSATRGQAAFINACLRRFGRERPALLAAVADDPVARWNHPRWWIEQLQRDHPQHWQALLQAAQQPPPMSLRVNQRRLSRDAWMLRLAQAGVAARAMGPSHPAGVVLARPLPVAAIPGFAEGDVSVQDGAAQRAAPLLLAGQTGARPRVLDACAAPGGKTAHVLELCPGADVLALDVDPARCNRIRDNLHRLGLQADVRAADAAQPATWWDGRPFDAILLDAPCSASGIGRRHPDVRWLRRASDVQALAAIQATLLAALWPLLRPGGRLLYATCSVFRAEGQAQAKAFAAAHSDTVALAAPGHLLPAAHDLPDHGGEDGFFYALFEKRPA